MERTEVTSSNIASVGYDPEAEKLEVEFGNGMVYAYSGVPEETHRDLMAAPSIGRFLNQRIKGVYDCEKVEE